MKTYRIGVTYTQDGQEKNNFLDVRANSPFLAKMEAIKKVQLKLGRKGRVKKVEPPIQLLT